MSAPLGQPLDAQAPGLGLGGNSEAPPEPSRVVTAPVDAWGERDRVGYERSGSAKDVRDRALEAG